MTSYACLASELLALRRRQKVCGWQARKFLFPSEFNSVAKTRNWVNLVSHKTHIYYWTGRLGKQFIIKVVIFLEQREVASLSPSKICENLNFSKGQLISKAFFGVLDSPKKRTKNI